MKTNLLQGCLLLISMQLPAQIDLQPQLISDAFDKVVDIANAGDDRLFIVEQDGRIRILQAGGGVNAEPFLDIDAKVSSGGERGLLGLAFHPDYAENGYFFLNYIDNSGNTVVARYQVSTSNKEIADPTSETILLTISQPEGNHNGGDMNFGPDGYLYISTGDGGGAGDPQDNGQETATLLGKILRIDIDHDNTGSSYAIPPSNPLADGPGGNADEIWALGLRNPWRFSFDRQTGDMWIGDVGQSDREEIDFEPAGSPGGLNYGWRCYEGSNSYNTTGCETNSLNTFPVHEYSHQNGCSVNGGFVYRGTDYPQLFGLYLYSDYCNGRIWGLQKKNDQWENEELYDGSNYQFVTMGEDYRGELYLGSLNGEVYRITDASCTTDAPDMDLDDDPIPSGTYQAGDMLTSSGTIAAETNVTFKAVGKIVLEPGFQVQAESNFLATIEECVPAVASFAARPITVERPKVSPVPDIKLFPNPLRSNTTMRYTLPEAAEVEISVWDIYGQVVARPVPDRRQDAGVHDLLLDASRLPAGIYLVVLRTGFGQQVGRMEVIR